MFCSYTLSNVINMCHSTECRGDSPLRERGARLQSGAGELLPCDLSTCTYQYATLKILKGLLKNLLLVKGLVFLPHPRQTLSSPSREKSCQQPNAWERILVIAVRFYVRRDKYICHKAQRKHNRMWANIKLAETHNQLSRTLSPSLVGTIMPWA